MKNVLFPVILLFLSSCNSSDKTTDSESDTVESPLSFNIDYSGSKFKETKSYAAFEQFFVDSNSIRIDNIDVKKGEENI